MHIYRSTLLAVFIAASSVGSSPKINAQSFGYPQNSSSIFSRWANRDQKPSHASESFAQARMPQNIPNSQSLQPLTGGRNRSANSNLIRRIKSYDNRSSYSLSPHRGDSFSNTDRTSAQTTWLQPTAAAQQERSILEVVEDQPNNTQNLIRNPRDTTPTALGNDASLPTNNQTYPRVAARQAPAANQGQTAQNYRTSAKPLSTSSAPRSKTELSATQAIIQRQQEQKLQSKPATTNVRRNSSASQPIARGSFQDEFNKAYRYIDNVHATKDSPTNIAAKPSVRIAQSNAVNAIRISNPNVANNDDAVFDLIPDENGGSGNLQLPPLNDVKPSEFNTLELSGNAPNDDSSFSPPNSMIFEMPALETTASKHQREPDLLPPLHELQQEEDTPPAAENFDAPPSSIDLTKTGDAEFPLVKTPDTWSPPVVPHQPNPSPVASTLTTPPASSPSASVPAQRFDSVETIDEEITWWKQRVSQPLNARNMTQPVDTNGLVFEALRSSPLIKAVSKTPLIRELQVVEADAEFDTVRFLNSKFEDRVDPVGNSLTTGGEPFLEDNIFRSEAGIRKRLRNGGDYNLSQTIGFQNSNSTFFTPQDQGTATLALNVTQPLLRGRGRYVNQSQILIAQSTGSAAWDTFKSDLQQELESVVSAYWDLYLQRSIFLQKKRNVERSQVMLDRLTGRQGLDSLPAQIARAKSAVLTRRTELANAFRDVRNAETEIRRRIAEKDWQTSQSIELIPVEMPFAQSSGLELEQVVYTALENRPEIAEAIRRIRIAGVQRDVSANELLPKLNLLLGTYVSSLRGDTGILNAFQDQFGQVTPGYSVGLEYELPYRNRAARSRLQQRNLQFRRLQNELEEVIQNVIAESQIATRQVSSAFETLKAAREAVVASRADLAQNEKRWESFALVEGDIADGQSPTIVLDQLLDSQERLAQAENVYAEAEQGLKIAEVSLQRIMGTLLMHQQVDFRRSVSNDVPSIHINKADPSTAINSHSMPPQFNQPAFYPGQSGEPEYVQQNVSQLPVATLQSITPTPAAAEVAQLMRRPVFGKAPATTQQTIETRTPSSNRAASINRASHQSWAGFKPQPSGSNRPRQMPSLNIEPPLIMPVGYQFRESAPRIDHGR